MLCSMRTKFIYRRSRAQKRIVQRTRVKNKISKNQPTKQNTNEEADFKDFCLSQSQEFKAFKIPRYDGVKQFSKDTELFVWIVEIPESCSETFSSFLQTLKKTIALKRSDALSEEVEESFRRLRGKFSQTAVSEQIRASEFSSKTSHEVSYEHPIISDPSAPISPSGSSKASTQNSAQNHLDLPESLKQFLDSVQANTQLVLFLQELRDRRRETQRRFIQKYPAFAIEQSIPSYVLTEDLLSESLPSNAVDSLFTKSQGLTDINISSALNFPQTPCPQPQHLLFNTDDLVQSIDTKSLKDTINSPSDSVDSLIKDFAEVYLLLLGQAARLAESYLKEGHSETNDDTSLSTEFEFYDRYIFQRLCQCTIQTSPVVVPSRYYDTTKSSHEFCDLEE